MKSMTRQLLLASLFAASAAQANEPSQRAPALLAKMLDRLGGKSNWAALTNTVNGSIQNRAIEPTEVYSVITMDFTAPRFSIETTSKDIYLKRVINGDKSWRISWSGVVEDLPNESYEADMLWHDAHIYRTIHRLASDDPKLSVQTRADRLEVIENKQRLIWFKLDAKGEPYAFGFRGDDRGSLSGPWNVIKQGIRHPSWVTHADGTWRAAVKALEFNVPLHDSQFARPETES